MEKIESMDEKGVPGDEPGDENDAGLLAEVENEFARFCDDAYIKAKGGCCGLIMQVDRFLPESGSAETKKEIFKEMDIRTHGKIDPELCGKAVHTSEGESRVTLTPSESMAVDEHGLVHGGFVFGLADYAAMIAVNHPNVVLGGAVIKFLKPVRTGEPLVAAARVKEKSGKKQVVETIVTRDETRVFEGELTCFVLERHVLSRN